MNNPTKIIFAGTPEFAVTYLEGLINDPAFLIVGVITQPDKPSGRKQTLTASAIKLIAQSHKLPILQPQSQIDIAELLSDVKKLNADLLIVVAYGQIIPKSVLGLFPLGAINVHPSLLPKYRGASPIQSALLVGERETGISIMLMDDKMDHGAILAQEKIALSGEETNESLHNQLADSGVPLLIATVKKFLSGVIKPKPQDDSQATFCATITKEDGRIDWHDSAQAIKQKIYAFYPWPATWTTMDNLRIKIFPPGEIITGPANEPGMLEIYQNELVVNCGTDKLVIKKIQIEGKNEISTKDFVRGHQNVNGKMLI